MLTVLSGVRDQILERCAGKSIDLETVTKVFCGLTIIDVVAFVPYDAPASNPIIGEFTRWSRSPGVYVPSQTIVEVRYASHLTVDWRRFVVCKELCHALDESDGVHDVSNSAISGLVNSFALRSSSAHFEKSLLMHTELMAEASALEILCPIEGREEMIAKGDTDQAAQERLAKQCNFPPIYAQVALDAEYVRSIKGIMFDS